MAQQWTSFRDYSDTHHVLGAAWCFVHPGNGSVYGWTCEQIEGKHQNLVIWRSVQGGAPEKVVTFQGTLDAQSFITAGGCVIGQGGALWVATTLQPIGKAYDVAKRTGFEGVWCRIPGVDAPWGLSSLVTRLNAIETALGTISQGGLDAGDREALDRLRAMLRL